MKTCFKILKRKLSTAAEISTHELLLQSRVPLNPDLSQIRKKQQGLHKLNVDVKNVKIKKRRYLDRR